MSRQTIPEKRIIKCDHCKKEIKQAEGTLVLTYVLRDYQGAACAEGKREADFCSDCLHKEVVPAVSRLLGESP